MTSDLYLPLHWGMIDRMATIWDSRGGMALFVTAYGLSTHPQPPIWESNVVAGDGDKLLFEGSWVDDGGYLGAKVECCGHRRISDNDFLLPYRGWAKRVGFFHIASKFLMFSTKS